MLNVLAAAERVLGLAAAGVSLFMLSVALRTLPAATADAPTGEILATRVEHLLAKEALLADPSGLYFTTPHFDGYPAILVELERIEGEDLEELIIEGWLARATKRLAGEYLVAREGPPANDL